MHSGRVGGGELGDVPDAHHELRVRPSLARRGVADERLGEAEAEGLDDRIDEVRHAGSLDRRDQRHEGVEPPRQLGEEHDARAVLRNRVEHLDVVVREAEHERGAGIDGEGDLAGVERVDADAEAVSDEPAHDVGQPRKRQTRRAADVDDVGAGLAIVRRLRANLVRRQSWRVVDLGHDLDVVRAVVARELLVAEVFGDLAKVLGALADGDAGAAGDDLHVALAEPGDEDQLRAGRHVEKARDPRRRHERGDRDAEHGDVVREGGRHLGERPAERGLGERAGDEEHAARRRRPGRGGRHGARATACRRRARTCWAFPRARRRSASRARRPRSGARARSPCR